VLKGIHSLLHAELLHVLASMGHGDELAIVDGNFPAAALARRLIQLPVSSAAQALDAILTLFPLDAVAAPPALTMQVIGDATAVPEVVRDFAAVLSNHGVSSGALGSLEREAFYARARGAFAIVRTAELRPYGNILLVKGVVNRYPPA
jgi:L-fucose mutarotase